MPHPWCVKYIRARTALRKAAYALDQFFDVIEERPEAKADVISRVGEAGVKKPDVLRSSLKGFVEKIDVVDPHSQPPH